MAVSVEHLADGRWEVTFLPGEEDEQNVILPADSWSAGVPERGIRFGNRDDYLMFGLEDGRIKLYTAEDPMAEEELYSDMGLPADDNNAGLRERIFEELSDAWAAAGGPLMLVEGIDNDELAQLEGEEDEGAAIRQAEEEFEAAQAQAAAVVAENTDESGMANVPKGGRRSRLKKKARRTKRKTRNNKRRQLRKLATRRR